MTCVHNEKLDVDLLQVLTALLSSWLIKDMFPTFLIPAGMAD